MAELLVVIAIIGLLLAITVPSMMKMAGESRFTEAQQSLNGLFTRAWITASADQNLTAVRFMPGAWDYQENRELQTPAGRQHAVIYSYRGSTENPASVGQVVYSEAFERRSGIASLPLPADLWAAPLEGLTPGAAGQNWLTGPVNSFQTDAASAGANFLDADDFLIVIDPRSGIRGAPPRAYGMSAYDPSAGYQWNGGVDAQGAALYRRYNFTGIALYRREPFAALGGAANAQLRQDWLRGNSRPFLVHPWGGGLVAGAKEAP